MRTAKVFIQYTNYKGEEAIRRIEPRHIWFGATHWHPEPQWLLSAWDVDKQVLRAFAMANISDWKQDVNI